MAQRWRVGAVCVLAAAAVTAAWQVRVGVAMGLRAEGSWEVGGASIDVEVVSADSFTQVHKRYLRRPSA